jgi:DMSO/TMAO reductase YedYZ molybdopterin-dependent catalytic subunit
MMGHVRRPFSIEKALVDDTLLVYGMNGDTLLLDHGFPARVLVPGWIGVASIKWVGSIEVSETPLMSPFNTELYRLFGDDYPPEGELLTLQNVKSAFELPFPAELRHGKHVLHGRSWSGNGRIERVDISIDDRHYRRAELQPPNLPQAWVRWDFEWDAQRGDHVLRARATDETGETQPDEVPFNNLGYTFGAIVKHPVTVK